MSNFHAFGGQVYSYSTMIREQVGMLSIGNITKYSVTTSRHQKIAQVSTCDILLDNVPAGTYDLFALALTRGLINEEVERMIINEK